MAGMVRYGAPSAMASFIDAADPVFGTGTDGDATLDGSSTVLGMVPASNVYSMTSDLYFNNLTINAGVRLSPNGYRIFVKNILTLNNNSIIGFTTGYSTAGSIAQRRSSSYCCNAQSWRFCNWLFRHRSSCCIRWFKILSNSSSGNKRMGSKCI